MTFTNALSSVDVFDYTTQNYAAASGATILGPGQGFWAYATSAGASVTIPESAKSANNSTNLRMATNDDSFMKLTLASTDITNTMAYTLKIASDENASDGWDTKDHPYRKSPNRAAPSIISNCLPQ